MSPVRTDERGSGYRPTGTAVTPAQPGNPGILVSVIMIIVGLLLAGNFSGMVAAVSGGVATGGALLLIASLLTAP